MPLKIKKGFFLLFFLWGLSLLAAEKSETCDDFKYGCLVGDSFKYAYEPTFIPREFSTFVPHLPKVNVITGEYCEEECDLVVSGIEPLAFKRFYAHNGYKDTIFGHWRVNPECFMFFNFDINYIDYLKCKKFAAVGNANGSVLLYDKLIEAKGRDNQYVVDGSKIKSFMHEGLSGETHPLNERVTYHCHVNKKAANCRYTGTIQDGSGNVRSFITDDHHYPQVAAGSLIPPYQARIEEERKPNGNIIRYTYDEYHRMNGRNDFPKHYVLTSITAYNSTKTEVLGFLKIHFIPSKTRYVLQKLILEGSDKREASLFHQLREVKVSPRIYDVVLDRVSSPDKPIQTYHYRWESSKKYADAPFLYLANEDKDPYLQTNYDLKSKKVISQCAAVGPNGELAPIARYEYYESQTAVHDGENNKTVYFFDVDKRITSVNKYQNNRLYSAVRNKWHSYTGNLLEKRIDDQSRNSIYIAEYQCDKNHNVIKEKISGKSGEDIIHRTFSDDGFNLKLSESDRDGKEIKYTYVPQTNLLTSEIVYDHGRICKRTFHSYDERIGSIRVKTTVDDGKSLDPNDLSYVTYRRITEISPKRTLPCLGYPEEVREKTIDLAGNEILLKKVRYTYHPSGKILKEDHYDAHDCYRYSLSNEYDDKERLVATINPLGHKTRFTYDARFNLLTEQGPRKGAHKEWVYDLANRPIVEKEWQEGGFSITKQKKYDKASRLIAVTDECGFETRYEYDSLGRVVTVFHPDGGIEKKGYDVLNNLTLDVDPNGYETSKKYNFRSQLTDIYRPDGSEEHFIYNDNGGLLATHIDSLGTKTLYFYDIFDHPIRTEVYSSEGELLKVTQATYSPFCKLSETDENGCVTTFVYDYAGRKIAEKKENLETHTVYDELGDVLSVKGPCTARFKQYDFLGRVTEERTEDLLGTVTFQEKYRYDEEGNRTHVTTCQGTTETCYNCHKLPTSIRKPDGSLTAFTYSFEKGFKKITQDPCGIQKIETHDPCKRLKAIQVLNKDQKTIQAREFVYDLAGNRTQTIEHVYEGTTPSHTITNTYSYGPCGHLEKLLESDLKETCYLYDRGRLQTLIKPDKTEIHHAYDALGRLKTLKANGIHYIYTYDPKGRILSVQDKNQQSVTERSYDPFDHILEEKLANGYDIKYHYNEEGKLAKLSLPYNSAATFSYIADKLHQVSYKGLTTTYQERNLEGKATLVTLPSNLGKIRFEYDSCSRIKSSISPYFTAIDYTYDPMGHLLRYTYTDSIGPVTRDFLYDDLYQLILENEESYAYDSLHNRTRKNTNRYTLNPLSQVTHDGDQDYIYDLNGNLIQAGETRFDYDALDRLTHVHVNGKTYEYVYDPFNRRILKKTPSKEIFYIWQLKNEIGSSEGDLRILGEGPAEIGSAVLVELNHEMYLPFHDQRGALVTLIDLKGIPVETIRYTAFGEELTSSSFCPWRFCSKRMDPETELLYFGRRYYSPILGRWISPDPRGFEDGPNLYAYVHNSPLLEIDLYGEWAYFQRAREWGAKMGRESFDFAFPCMSALYNLPSEASYWKRGALLAGSGIELALMASGPLKGAVSLTEKAILQIGKSALSREAERQVLRSAEKATTIATEKQISHKAIISDGRTAFDQHSIIKSRSPVLNRGSTVNVNKSTLPRNLREQLAVEQAMSSPGAGDFIDLQLSDARWPRSMGWQKWQQEIKPGGDTINVHYLYNPRTGAMDDFKIILKKQ